MNIRTKIYGGEEAGPDLLGAKRPKGAKADKLASVSVPREAKRLANSRVEDRHRLLSETVRLTHKGRARELELINLSGGGAMVGGFKAKLWDRVELHLGKDGTIECAVRWIRDGRVGLEFAHETRLDCPADEQAQLLREVITRSFSDIAFEPRPGAEAEPESGPEIADELRFERRHPLIWSGVLQYHETSAPVRLRNISSTGAMIDCEAMVFPDTNVVLDLGESGFIPARIAWVVGDQVGLGFKRKFDMARLADSKPEVAPPTWVPPDYLRSPKASETRGSGHWGRMSLGQLRHQLEGFLRH